MLTLLKVLSVLGTVMFGALLYFVISQPKAFEQNALSFAKQQIQSELAERDSGGFADKVTGLKALSESLRQRQRRLTEALNSNLPELIAAVTSQRCGCEDQADTADRDAAIVRSVLAQSIRRLSAGQRQIVDLIAEKYDTILAALRKDVLIFLATNLAAFCLLITASATQWRQATLLPGYLLIASVGISSWMYMFDQNWFYTILYGSYYGYAYTAMMLILFGFLLDLVLNRAKITRAVLDMVGGSLTPC